MVKIKQNHLLIFALLCFMFFNLRIRHDLIEKKLIIEQIKNEIGFQDKKIKVIENYVNYSLNLNFLYNGKSLDNLIVFDSTFQEKKISSFSIPKPCLVFCFAESHCKNCVETAIMHIGKILGDGSNVIVLGAFSDSRDLIIYMSSMSCKYAAFRAAPLDPIIDITSMETPAFFILSPNNTISDIFVYDQEYNERLDQYLQHSTSCLE